MLWNWQQADWPHFSFDPEPLEALERQFLLRAGEFTGSFRHVASEDRDSLLVEILTDEALRTSEIEGEMLNRDSLQSSIRRHFGLQTDHRRPGAGEAGAAEMMTDLCKNALEPMTAEMLFRWHSALMNGRRDLQAIGQWRSTTQPMQVVSGAIHNPKVHFEAPPSKQMEFEMERFLQWLSGESLRLGALARAGMAHLYFVSIHPFEDGNGRIARAIAEKCLAEASGERAIIPISPVIQLGRKNYYHMLERSNQALAVTEWLVYFAEVTLQAQVNARELVEFLIKKTQFFDRFRDRLNERQTKVIHRMFREGPKGFEGGLSAENYVRITATSRPTATRDLQQLVEIGVLQRQGQLKGTRYFLQ